MGFTSKLDGVQLKQNTPNVYTPILEYVVPAGVEVLFPKSQRIIAKLYNSAGNEIADDSELYWAYKKSSAVPYYKPLTHPIFYFELKNLSLADQMDVNKAIIIHVDEEIERRLGGRPGVKFGQDAVIALLLKSSDTVDWTQGSYVALPETRVRM